MEIDYEMKIENELKKLNKEIKDPHLSQCYRCNLDIKIRLCKKLLEVPK